MKILRNVLIFSSMIGFNFGLFAQEGVGAANTGAKPEKTTGQKIQKGIGKVMESPVATEITKTLGQIGVEFARTGAEILKDKARQGQQELVRITKTTEFEEEMIRPTPPRRSSRGGRRATSRAPETVSVSSTDINKLNSDIFQAIDVLNKQEVTDQDLDDALSIVSSVKDKLVQLSKTPSSRRAAINIEWGRIENMINDLGSIVNTLSEQEVSDEDLDAVVDSLQGIQEELSSYAKPQQRSTRGGSRTVR